MADRKPVTVRVNQLDLARLLARHLVATRQAPGGMYGKVTVDTVHPEGDPYTLLALDVTLHPEEFDA